MGKIPVKIRKTLGLGPSLFNCFILVLKVLSLGVFRYHCNDNSTVLEFLLLSSFYFLFMYCGTTLLMPWS